MGYPVHHHRHHRHYRHRHHHHHHHQHHQHHHIISPMKIAMLINFAVCHTFRTTRPRYYHTAKFTTQVDECFDNPDVFRVQMAAGTAMDTVIRHSWMEDLPSTSGRGHWWVETCWNRQPVMNLGTGCIVITWGLLRVSPGPHKIDTFEICWVSKHPNLWRHMCSNELRQNKTEPFSWCHVTCSFVFVHVHVQSCSYNFHESDLIYI